MIRNLEKMILVNMSAWRCGSSMMVGTINLLGASVGTINSNNNQENPVGSFQNKFFMGLQHSLFDDHIKMFPDKLMPINEIKNIQTTYQLWFNSIRNIEFGAHNSCVIKCMMSTMVPFAINQKDVVMPYIINLKRNVVDQSRSLAKARFGHKNPPPQMIEWVTRCYRWNENYLKETNVPYLEVLFENVLDNPQKELERICNYTGLKINDEAIRFIRPEFSRSRTK